MFSFRVFYHKLLLFVINIAICALNLELRCSPVTTTIEGSMVRCCLTSSLTTRNYFIKLNSHFGIRFCIENKYVNTIMMRFIVPFVIQSFIGFMVNGDETTSSALDVRQLQTNQTLNYRATYKADFQHLSDFICTAEPPVLQISCYGTAMQILSVSDTSITCVQLNEPIINNGTSYQCVNTCDST